MEFMTREVFDALIVAVMLIGGALAALRLYRDFTRPMPHLDDTQQHKAVNINQNANEE